MGGWVLDAGWILAGGGLGPGCQMDPCRWGTGSWIQAKATLVLYCWTLASMMV